MKHYYSPVIKLVCYRQTDVIRTSNPDAIVNSISTNDTDVEWGGTW